MKEPVPAEFYEWTSQKWEIEAVPTEWSLFFQALQNRVSYLYQNEPERLLQILYRLDVPEEQFIYATQLDSVGATVQYLTQKIVEREWKRYQFKKNYKP